ncbi:LuxR C-terminal-related transcriptional regulator [Actinosynnema sp. CA-299493]
MSVSARATEPVESVIQEVYRHALAKPSVTVAEVATDLDLCPRRVERAVVELCRLRLLVTADTYDRFFAVGPEEARVDLVVPMERRISELREELTEVDRRLQTFGAVFAESRRDRGGPESVVVCADYRRARHLVREATIRSRDEVLALRPCRSGDFPPAHKLATVEELELLRRGVRMRTVYPHTARADTRVCDYVRLVAAHGAEVRTTEDVGHRVLVFDRELAIIPAGQGIALVRASSVVVFLSEVFEDAWAAGREFDADTAPAGEPVDDVRSLVLEMLVAGHKDDVIARRLGISTRTCRRHVAAIMAELRAESRFQAGFAAARSGLLDLDALVD